MSTTMHRLQISLPKWQVRFLAEQARRQGVSMAEVIRRLIQREVETSRHEASNSTIWEIAGIAEDHGPLIDGIAVSERPELYILGGPGDAEDSE